jgi:hypothetical protein
MMQGRGLEGAALMTGAVDDAERSDEKERRS